MLLSNVQLSVTVSPNSKVVLDPTQPANTLPGAIAKENAMVRARAKKLFPVLLILSSPLFQLFSQTAYPQSPFANFLIFHF
jgi:hypothetical protein